MKAKLFICLQIVIYWGSYLVPKSKKIWVFGEWYGQRYADNPRYFFEYVNKEHPNIKSIWITKSKNLVSTIKQSGFECFYYKSLKAIYYQLRCKKVFYCQRLLDDISGFLISGNVDRVQLWHGVPLKKIGFDVKPEYESQLRIKNLKKLIAPFLYIKPTLVVACSDYDKNIFARAFGIDINRVKVLGYPRNDYLISNKKPPSHPFKVLYAPTLRETKGRFFNGLISEDIIDHLGNKLKHHDIHLLIKFHPLNLPTSIVNQKINDSDVMELIPNNENIYEHLIRANVLVTDYSSLIFDAMLLHKPIIHYISDLEIYVDSERQLYTDYAEVVSGVQVNTVEKLIEKLVEIKNKSIFFSRNNNKLCKKYFKYQDKSNSFRLFKLITEIG